MTGMREQYLKTRFLITMNYAQKHDLIFIFFIKVVVNNREAYIESVNAAVLYEHFWSKYSLQAIEVSVMTCNNYYLLII